MVYRIDSTPIGKAIRHDNGWLRAPARVSRTGILEYRMPDGSVRRELRLAEDVFHPDAMQSFELVPLVDDHPRGDGELNAENTIQHIVGSVGKLHRDGEFLGGELLVYDAETISKIESGKQELSCGYYCDTEETPGEWNGQRYDAIQRNIRGNHVAVVAQGRAGPMARVRLDTADVGVLVSTPEQTISPVVTRDPMLKFKIDGVEVEVSEAAAQLIEKERAAAKQTVEALRGERDGVKAEVEKLTARADAADAKAKELQAKLDSEPARIREELKSRAALETQAVKVLGADFKFDGLDDLAVRKAMLVKLTKSDAKAFDGKSADYIQARLDAALEDVTKTNPASAEAAARLSGGKKADGADLTPEQALLKAIHEKHSVRA